MYLENKLQGPLLSLSFLLCVCVLHKVKWITAQLPINEN